MSKTIRKWIKQYSQWFTPIILFIVAIGIFLAIFLNHTIDDSHHRAQAEVVADALLLEKTIDMRLATDMDEHQYNDVRHEVRQRVNGISHHSGTMPHDTCHELKE